MGFFRPAYFALLSVLSSFTIYREFVELLLIGNCLLPTLNIVARLSLKVHKIQRERSAKNHITTCQYQFLCRDAFLANLDSSLSGKF